MDLMGCCRVFASSGFMYLMAVLIYKTHPSVVMVRESLPTPQDSMERPELIKYFPSGIDMRKPNDDNVTSLLILLQCSYYQDFRALLILSSHWLCIPLTPSASKGKKWRKLSDRNEASSKGEAATSVTCTSTKLRRVNFKGSEASFLQQLDEENMTHISTDRGFFSWIKN